MYFQIGVRGLYTSLRSSSLIVQNCLPLEFSSLLQLSLRLSLTVMVALFYSLKFVSFCFESFEIKLLDVGELQTALSS